MKDLSIYISEACSISETLITDYLNEARTLKDLKDKKISKIRTNVYNMEIKEENSGALIVYIHDISELNEKDIEFCYMRGLMSNKDVLMSFKNKRNYEINLVFTTKPNYIIIHNYEDNSVRDKIIFRWEDFKKYMEALKEI